MYGRGNKTTEAPQRTTLRVPHHEKCIISRLVWAIAPTCLVRRAGTKSRAKGRQHAACNRRYTQRSRAAR
eukprot:5673458-Prymnesium_polylepis.1